MNRPIDRELVEQLGVLFRRYLADECTPAEEAELRRAAASVFGFPDAIDELRAIWERGAGAHAAQLGWHDTAPDQSQKVDARWMELARNLHLAAASPPPATGTPRPRPPLAFNPFGTRQRSRLRFAALAAVLVVAAAGGAGVWLARGGAKGVPRATLRATLALRTISTPSGQRATVRLADGSRVVLAPASRLTYGERFGTGRDRTVDLVGEGYFDVIHDARRPFRVRTAHAITQDVGTAFVVRAYVGDRTERVAVEEGRVRVRARLDTAGLHAAHLTHGRAATVSVAGDPTPRVGTADPRTDFSWVRDTLVFNATPASDVAAAIGRWYDVDVVLADTAMRARQLTLSLSDETTDQALGVLAALLHARVVRQGRRASLVSR